MSPRAHDQRDRRIRELQARPSLSPCERGELDRLVALRDARWRQLPRQIAAARAKLRRLEETADALGLGPC